MESLAISVSVGAAMVFIFDLIRKYSGLEGRTLKIVIGILSFLFALAVYGATKSSTVDELLTIAAVILGTTQTIFAMWWKDTDTHKELTK